METQHGGEEYKQAANPSTLGWIGSVKEQPSTLGWIGSVKEQYEKIKENAETYPYVWASYIVVYGGFALWTTYRWRRLRKTEDRVLALQDRLRKLVESEESAVSTSSKVEKTTSSIDKSS